MPFGDTPAFDRGIDRGVMMPVGELITSALSNKGNATGFGQDNTFRVRDAEEVRIVDNKGQVLFSGTGPDAARQAVAIGQSITDEKGNKAGWTIQAGERTINTDGSVGPTRYYDVANEKVNKNVLGQIADVALPIAAGFIPGVGPVLGAALGSAASSVAQGRSLENTLLRAGLAAGSSYLGGQLFGPATPKAPVPTDAINADLIPNALEGLSFGSIANTSIPAGVGGDILVTAAKKTAPNILGSAAGNAIGQAALSQIAAPNESNVVDGVDRDTGEIVVSKYRPINPPGGFDPIAFLQGPGLGSALAGVPALTELAMDPTLTGPAEEDIVVTGNKTVPKTVVPDVLAGLGPLLPTLGIPQVPTPDPALTDKGGVLGTGLNLPQLVSIGGVGADLLKNLLAGGGDTGAGTPYVSPFGTGVGFARGQDMRANPNITDYERYGFGPEAMFFRPEYSGLLSSAAPAPQAQPAMAINPVYQPLI